MDHLKRKNNLKPIGETKKKHLPVFPYTFAQLFICIFIWFLISVGIIMLILATGLSRYFDKNLFLFAVTSTSGLIMILFFIVLNNEQGRSLKEDIRFLKNISLFPYFLIFLIIFHFGFLFPLFSGFLKIRVDTSIGPGIIKLTNIFIISPVLNEIIFRGFILKGLFYSYSVKKAIFISSVCFFVAYINPFSINYEVLTSSFFLGFFLGWLYFKKRNLVLNIIIHFFSNSLVVIKTNLQFFIFNNSREAFLFNLNFSVYLLIFLFSIFLLVFIILLIQKK